MFIGKEGNSTISSHGAQFAINGSTNHVASPHAVADMPVIDMAYLRQFSGGDIEFEKEILQSSMEEIEEKMTLLQTALQANNMDATSSIAHSLKSLCSIIGSTQHFELYKKVETFCSTISLYETEALCNKAAESWPMVKSFLNQYMLRF